MRKHYLWLLSLALTMLTGLSSYADITVKVSGSGIAESNILFAGNNEIQTPLHEGENILKPTQGTMTIGELRTDAPYTMEVKNATRNTTINVLSDNSGSSCNINPGNSSAGETILVTVKKAGVPAPQTVTIAFNPENCGYVMMNDVKYDSDDDDIMLEYDAVSDFLICPKEGYTLTKCLDESQASNPHYEGILPSPTDGFIHCSMGSLDSGAVLVVMATKNGSFTVKGVGSNISNIYFSNNNTYEQLSITEQPQTVNFAGNVEYTIRSMSSSPLWKIEVTNDGETSELAGNYGSFHYTPYDGDEVTIYTDIPVTYTDLSIAFEGEGVNNAIVSKVSYNYEPVYDASSDNPELSLWILTKGMTLESGRELNIQFNMEGFSDVTYSVNGSEPRTPTITYGSFGAPDTYNARFTLAEGDCNVIISAKTVKPLEVTVKSNYMDGFTIHELRGMTPGDALPVGTSGSKLSVNYGKQLKFIARNGYRIKGFLLDGKEPEDGAFSNNTITITDDLEITVNILDLADIRTKTAVIYVEEKEGWQNLGCRFPGEDIDTPLSTGYNFVKYSDEDLPFTINGGFMKSMELEESETGETETTQYFNATYYINDATVNYTDLAYRLQNFKEGDVVKLYQEKQTPKTLTYSIDKELAGIVNILHDHILPVKAADWNGTVLPGSEIELVIGHVASSARSAYINEEAKEYLVKANGEEILPSDEGVYSVKVNDDTAIFVEKNSGSGIDSISSGEQTFPIFNLQGIAVIRHATKADFNSLPAGIYICDGKKIIVK